MRARYVSRVVAFVVVSLQFVPARALAGPNDAAPPAGEVTITDNARAHFKAGVALLKDPDGERYEEAYVEFKAAYADSPSPKILGNLALCAMKLERLGEAIEAYEKYLALVPDVEAFERKQVEQDLTVMRTSAVTVTVRVNVPGSTLSDKRTPLRGLPIVNTYSVAGETKLLVRPGRHELVVRNAGYDDATVPFEATPGSSVTHDFVLSKSVPKRSGQSWVPFALIGGGVLLGGAGLLTGLTANNKADAIRRACPDARCPLDYDLDGRRSTVDSLALATDVLVGTAIVAAGVGAAWLIFGSSSSPSKPAVGGAFGPGGWGLTMRGGF